MEMEKIEALAQLMNRHGLSVVSITENGEELRLERPAVPMPSPLSAASVTLSVPAPKDESGVFSRGEEICAPMVGIFYSASGPESKPFVQVGQRVKRGDVLCIIEAMKLMNEVTAERDGEIADICADNGQLVEYGQCLMKLI
ncbi:MAG: acetyl-CoA carboxylase, biotin carboxyl carrier protein [Oscillospiraceae bacterium]|nr:acetyl-CoA carboxylase, biotin carboxyl carrier protein [Oscillospiraceae bacterium]